jgi:hypothetical protein
MQNCPRCGFEINADFGMVNCSSCGELVLLDDENSKVEKSASRSKKVTPPPPPSSAPLAIAPEAAEEEFDFSAGDIEVVPHGVASEPEPVPDSSSTAF